MNSDASLQRHISVHYRIFTIWAIVMLLVGHVGMSHTGGLWQSFYSMSIIWSTVNLLIACFLWYHFLKRPHTPFWQKTMANKRVFRRFVFINVVLDLLYIVTALWLINRKAEPPVYQPVTVGFGRAVLLQGVFMLAIDGISGLILRYRRRS